MTSWDVYTSAGSMASDESRSSCSSAHCISIDAATRRVVTYSTRSRGNRFGQLGRGRECSPRGFVGLERRIISVAAGGSNESGHTAAVTAEGDVYTWGCDRWQQLGIGAWVGGKMAHAVPQRARVQNIRQVACGDDHTVALSRDGMTVYAWGRGEHGQLGRKVPVFVGDPERSDVLSSARALAGVVAVANCSATVDQSGTVMLTAGKCSGLRKRLEAAAAALLVERAELRTLG